MLKTNKIKHIITERLILRNIMSEDARPLWENLFYDPKQYWLFFQQNLKDYNMCQRFIDLYADRYGEDYFFFWAITRQVNSETIGLISLHGVDPLNNNSQIAWAIGEQDRNKGYATEAARSVINFGFKEVGLHTIVAEIVKYNNPSIRVAKKLGMKQIGTMPQSWWLSGNGAEAKYADQRIYTLVNR